VTLRLPILRVPVLAEHEWAKVFLVLFFQKKNCFLAFLPLAFLSSRPRGPYV
jgi:hypothetical protein